MSEIEEGYVKSSLSNGIYTVEFFHPKSNSMPGSLLSLLVQHLHRANTSDTKVIVLRSGGNGAFCAGASFDELLAVSNEEDAFRFFMGFANVMNEMRKSEKLIIARIHGKAVGGGVGIASAADYAIASDKAEIKLSELAIGIGPFTISPAVQRKLGISAFSQLSIDAGTWRNPQWAKEKGLFAEVYDTMERLDEAISRLAMTLSQYSSEAMAAMKKVFWSECESWDHLFEERAKISAHLLLSEHTRAAIGKIKEGMKKSS